MAHDVNVNKLNERDRRRLESIRDRLRAQNVGEDEATRLALQELEEEGPSGAGGGCCAGGEPKKREHGGADRTGGESGGGS